MVSTTSYLAGMQGMDKNWCSWAMVEWDMSADDAGDDRGMEEYPARLIMFFSIQNHNQFKVGGY